MNQKHHLMRDYRNIMNGFDSIQVRFKDVPHNESPFANTRVVPFVNSYFEILKGVVDDIKTEYFWF